MNRQSASHSTTLSFTATKNLPVHAVDSVVAAAVAVAESWVVLSKTGKAG